jgi:hypothetical protein
MNGKAFALAAFSIAVALLGSVGVLAIVGKKLVALQAVWVLSPHVALAVIGFL